MPDGLDSRLTYDLMGVLIAAQIQALYTAYTAKLVPSSVFVRHEDDRVAWSSHRATT